MASSPLLPLIVFLGSYAALAVTSFWARHEARTFLASTPTISDTMALDRFKTLARHNMYAALAQIPLGLAGIGAGLVVLFRHGVVGLLAVLAANSLLFFAARGIKVLEVRARSLPAATADLQQQHQAVGKAWVERPLPNF